MLTKRVFSIGAIATVLSACSSQYSLGMGLGKASPPDPSDPDATLKYKFRGMRGGERRIDALETIENVVLLVGNDQALRKGTFGRGASFSGYGGHGADVLPIYKTIRYLRYAKGAKFSGNTKHPYYEGEPFLDVQVPIAERIPDVLLDYLRSNPRASMRLKLRLIPETILVGWDIEHRPRFDPKLAQEGQYYPPAYSHTGGDFKEARPASYLWEGDDLKGLPSDIPVWSQSLAKKTPFWRYQSFISLPKTMTWPLSAADELLIQMNNLEIIHKGAIVTNPPTPLNQRRIWEKGWYIHPKTGQRIETDF